MSYPEIAKTKVRRITAQASTAPEPARGPLTQKFRFAKRCEVVRPSGWRAGPRLVRARGRAVRLHEHVDARLDRGFDLLMG